MFELQQHFNIESWFGFLENEENDGVFYHLIIFEPQTIDFLMVVVKRNRNYHAKSMLVNLTRSNYVGKKRFS